MKRRHVEVEISDHAVLRWLERAHGLDVNAIRRKLAGHAMLGAELKAIAVVVEGVRLVLVEAAPAGDGSPRVVVPTVLPLQRVIRPRRGPELDDVE